MGAAHKAAPLRHEYSVRHRQCAASVHFCVIQLVAQRHQTVNQMDVFDNDVGMADRNILVGKVPKGFYTAGNHPLHNGLCCLAGNAENAGVYGVVLAELLEQLLILNDNSGNLLADLVRRVVKNGFKGKARFGKIDVLGKGLAQISRSYEHGVKSAVEPQNSADFLVQSFGFVTVALLAELAEAIKILPDL